MPKKRDKSLEDMDFLAQAFVGELVKITTNITCSKPIHVQVEDVMTTELVPDLVCYQGFFIDADDDNIYLGDHTLKITSCIARDVAKIIEIEELKSPEDMILDSMDTPEDKESIN